MSKGFMVDGTFFASKNCFSSKRDSMLRLTRFLVHRREDRGISNEEIRRCTEIACIAVGLPVSEAKKCPTSVFLDAVSLVG